MVQFRAMSNYGEEGRAINDEIMMQSLRERSKSGRAVLDDLLEDQIQRRTGEQIYVFYQEVPQWFQVLRRTGLAKRKIKSVRHTKVEDSYLNGLDMVGVGDLSQADVILDYLAAEVEKASQRDRYDLFAGAALIMLKKLQSEFDPELAKTFKNLVKQNVFSSRASFSPEDILKIEGAFATLHFHVGLKELGPSYLDEEISELVPVYIGGYDEKTGKTTLYSVYGRDTRELAVFDNDPAFVERAKPFVHKPLVTVQTDSPKEYKVNISSDSPLHSFHVLGIWDDGADIISSESFAGSINSYDFNLSLGKGDSPKFLGILAFNQNCMAGFETVFLD